MRILITEFEEFSLVAKANLEKIGRVDVGVYTYSSLFEVIDNYEVLVVRLGIYFDSKLLDKAKKLKYIVTPTTGLDHIDLEYAKNLGVEVISLKGEVEFLESIPSTSEHTWGLLLALLRKTTSANTHVLEGGWDRNLFKGNNVRGKRLAIIGLGRVGKMIAEYGRVFGCETAFFDTDRTIITTVARKFDTIEELLEWGDIITVHIPYNEENRNYLNKTILSHVRENAFLINTSRGGIWDEKFISELVTQGKLGGVATDVLSDEFNQEGIDRNPLIAVQKEGLNVIITPHIAGATFESMAMTEEFVVSKLANKLQHV